MENLMIIAILGFIALMVGAVFAKGRGKKGCCGSTGDYKAKAKRLKNVTSTKVFLVEGMHCPKCSNRVMETVNDIAGVSASVELETGRVTVSYAQAVSDQLIVDRIQRLGFTVTDIRA